MKNTIKHNRQKLVSIVLITCNRKEDVRETLEELKKIDYKNYEIVVVDNGSTDGVAEMMEDEYSYIKLTRLPTNMKLRARNISFQKAKGEYLLCLDDDSHPEPEAIKNMLKHFRENPNMGIIACDVRCGDYFSTWYMEEGQEKNIFVGSGVGFRKRIFNIVGYYDETLENYAEEDDFCYRTLNRGIKIGFFKDVVVHHRPRKDPNRTYRFFCVNERNHKYLAWKFVSVKYWPILFLRSSCRVILRGWGFEKWHGVWYRILGSLWGLLWIPKGLEKREPLNKEIEEYFLLNHSYNRSVFDTLKAIITNNKGYLDMQSRVVDHGVCQEVEQNKKKYEWINITYKKYLLKKSRVSL